MLTILYNLFITPIQIIVEMTYSIMNRVFENKGISIIAVSLVIQTLILPLYKRADAIQEEEISKQKQMAPMVDYFKKNFKGDEQFMLLQTYYRQENYKTWYSLKSTISILLQIPFFIAAYNYLSHLEELAGVSFLFIKDLSLPDSLFTVGNFSVNILPIIMTLFNLISAAIYSKGMPIKDMFKTWGLAFVFLVLLYRSPSGLVLYWTCNNLYSLLKNVFMKLIGPSIKKEKNKKKISPLEKVLINSNNNTKLIVFEELFMTLLMGAFIPISVISSSTVDFVVGNSNPIQLIPHCLSIYAGFFIVWMTVFYSLMSDNVKKIFQLVLSGVCIYAFINYFIYGNKQGEMSQMLKYEKIISYTKIEHILSILLFVGLVSIVVFIAYKFPKAVIAVLEISIISMLILSGKGIYRSLGDMKRFHSNENNKAKSEIITFSKEGQNVAVIMIDRAIGMMLPYILEEKPELKERLDGFTFYPNTVSFGPCTNFGTPALFGGYEYTPTELDKRSTECLKDKHNEALLVLPTLFSEEGYNVTVCDPPYAGDYLQIPELSMYDSLENVNAYITEGAFNDFLDTEDKVKVQESHFIYYSMCKVVPTIIQGKLYNGGKYCTTLKDTTSIASSFVDCYGVLKNMEYLTKIDSGNSNNCLIFQNGITHWPSILKSPEYIPDDSATLEDELQKYKPITIDGVTLDCVYDEAIGTYHVHIAALELLCDWFDYLKENDVFDNTRIILVSDHGRELGQFENYVFSNGIDVEKFNPLLLYKDFNSKGELKTDNTFMTNGDTPVMALNGIIDNPINPFTGNEINNSEKTAHPQRITTSMNWSVFDNNGNTFDVGDDPWFTVHDDIFKEENWKEEK